MNQIHIADSMIRALKGSALSVLILLMNHPGETLSASFIGRNTGYSDEAVANGLLLLQDYGLAVRAHRYGWQLADGDTRQLPLGSYQLEQDGSSDGAGLRKNRGPETGTVDAEFLDSGFSGVQELPADPPQKLDSGKNGVQRPESRQNDQNDGWTPEKPESSSPLTIVSLVSCLPTDGYTTNQPTSGETSKTASETTSSAEMDKRERAVRAVCDWFGILGIKADELARSPKVTAEVVAYHCITCPPERGTDYGMAIWRALHRQHIPRNWEMPPDLSAHLAPFLDSPTPPGEDAGADLDQPAPEEPPAAAVEAWNQALEQLQHELPAAQFDTWVRSAELVGYEIAAHIFQIGAVNSYCHKWLHEHLAETLPALLASITGRPARVEFLLVAPDTRLRANRGKNDRLSHPAPRNPAQSVANALR